MNSLNSLIAARSAAGLPVDELSVRCARWRVERGEQWRFDDDGRVVFGLSELGPVRSFLAGMADSVREFCQALGLHR